MKFPYLVHRRYNTTTLPDIGRVNLALLMREFDFLLVNKLAQFSLNKASPIAKGAIITEARKLAGDALLEALLTAYRPK